MGFPNPPLCAYCGKPMHGHAVNTTDVKLYHGNCGLAELRKKYPVEKLAGIAPMSWDERVEEGLEQP